MDTISYRLAHRLCSHQMKVFFHTDWQLISLKWALSRCSDSALLRQTNRVMDRWGDKQVKSTLLISLPLQ